MVKGLLFGISLMISSSIFGYWAEGYSQKANEFRAAGDEDKAKVATDVAEMTAQANQFSKDVKRLTDGKGGFSAAGLEDMIKNIPQRVAIIGLAGVYNASNKWGDEEFTDVKELAEVEASIPPKDIYADELDKAYAKVAGLASDKEEFDAVYQKGKDLALKGLEMFRVLIREAVVAAEGAENGETVEATEAAEGE